MPKDALKLFSGNANIELAREIAGCLGVSLGKAEVKNFADGETYVSLEESVRGSDVFIIQPTCFPANDNLMELLIMIDACRRAAAKRITAVMPFFGYAKQDRKAKHREPITAKLVANLLEAAGADGVLIMDLHSDQEQGFFDIRVDFLYASQIILAYLLAKKLKNIVVVSPDIGSSKRARSYAKRLHCDLAIIDKRRPRPNVSEVMHLIGNVKGKNVIIVDDEINTGGTIVNAAEKLKKEGALDVYVVATHPVFAGNAVERLAKASITEIIVTNTIPIEKQKRIKKLTQLSVAELLAKGIKAIHLERSVSALLNPAD